MKKLLEKLSLVPGVAGCWICNDGDPVLEGQFLPGISEEAMQLLGRHLLKLLRLGHENNREIYTSFFRFDRHTVLTLPLASDKMLFAVCEAHANCTLISSTLDMLVDSEYRKSTTPPHQAVSEQDLAESPPAGNEEELRGLYDYIEECLGNAIGPVAAIVMQGILEKWQEDDAPSYQRIPSLIEMVLGEIDDEELAVSFQAMIQQIDIPEI